MSALQSKKESEMNLKEKKEFYKRRNYNFMRTALEEMYSLAYTDSFKNRIRMYVNEIKDSEICSWDTNYASTIKFDWITADTINSNFDKFKLICNKVYEKLDFYEKSNFTSIDLKVKENNFDWKFKLKIEGYTTSPKYDINHSKTIPVITEVKQKLPMPMFTISSGEWEVIDEVVIDTFYDLDSVVKKNSSKNECNYDAIDDILNLPLYTPVEVIGRIYFDGVSE